MPIGEKNLPSFPNTFLFGCFFLVFFGVIARGGSFFKLKKKKIDKIGGVSADSRAAGPKKDVCRGVFYDSKGRKNKEIIVKKPGRGSLL